MTAEFQCTDALALCVLDEPVHTNEVLTETGLWHDLPRDNSRRHYWVVTSPNVPYIPKTILGPRVIRVRKDGRYGLEDRVQHPSIMPPNSSMFVAYVAVPPMKNIPFD